MTPQERVAADVAAVAKGLYRGLTPFGHAVRAYLMEADHE